MPGLIIQHPNGKRYGVADYETFQRLYESRGFRVLVYADGSPFVAPIEGVWEEAHVEPHVLPPGDDTEKVWPPFSEWTVAELKAEAKRLGIDLPSKANKATIIVYLETAALRS